MGCEGMVCAEGRSVRFAVRIQRGLVGELDAGVGIDIQASSGAPGDEFVRIEVGAHDELALAAQLALGLFGPESPLRVGAGELVAVDHDLEHSGVRLERVPGDSNSANGR